jgi:hypothetical protein
MHPIGVEDNQGASDRLHVHVVIIIVVARPATKSSAILGPPISMVEIENGCHDTASEITQPPILEQA